MPKTHSGPEDDAGQAPQPQAAGRSGQPAARGLGSTPFDRLAPAPGLPAAVIATALTLIWLILMALLSHSTATNGTGVPRFMIWLAIVMPVALIWLAAISLPRIRSLRAEAASLRATIDTLRAAHLAQEKAAMLVSRANADRRPGDAARPAEGTFASRRDSTQIVPSANGKTALTLPRGTPEDQPALALGTPTEDLHAPISIPDFIRALNFPENPEDRDGFRALRLALEDRNTAKLIRAAQDVLTLLGQDSIYMDDLPPDRARPEVWRQFATGTRGRTIAPLGGIRDRSSLALTAGRMRQDTIFRDAAHHFLRQFDKSFSEFEQRASDQDINDLATTRTARAFMLLGRVMGIFD